MTHFPLLFYSFYKLNDKTFYFLSEYLLFQDICCNIARVGLFYVEKQAFVALVMVGQERDLPIL